MCQALYWVLHRMSIYSPPNSSGNLGPQRLINQTKIIQLAKRKWLHLNIYLSKTAECGGNRKDFGAIWHGFEPRFVAKIQSDGWVCCKQERLWSHMTWFWTQDCCSNSERQSIGTGHLSSISLTFFICNNRNNNNVYLSGLVKYHYMKGTRTQ